MQAAEQARQALGRGRSGLDGRGIVSVESLMDEIIDRAYDEDDEMGVSLPAKAWHQDRQQCSVSELLLLSAYTQALPDCALHPACLLPACCYLLERAAVRLSSCGQRSTCSMRRATAAVAPLAQMMRTWTPKVRRLTWARCGHSLTICPSSPACNHLMKAASPSPALSSGQRVNYTC